MQRFDDENSTLSQTDHGPVGEGPGAVAPRRGTSPVVAVLIGLALFTFVAGAGVIRFDDAEDPAPVAPTRARDHITIEIVTNVGAAMCDLACDLRFISDQAIPQHEVDLLRPALEEAVLGTVQALGAERSAPALQRRLQARLGNPFRGLGADLEAIEVRRLRFH